MQTELTQPLRLSSKDAANAGLSYIYSRWPILGQAIEHHRSTVQKPGGDEYEELTFHDKPWLAYIYKDESPTIIIQKCVQIGISEWALCSMFSFARRGKRGMYLLPDDEWRATFVADRVDGLLDRVPFYKANVGSLLQGGKQSDSKKFKNIFKTAWKFAGTHAKTAGSTADIKKPKAAFEYQADCLLIDEYDEHEATDLAYMFDRLASAKDPIVRLFGNPTIEGRGIAAEFAKSDQKYWYVECDKCGELQVLDWYKHFVKEEPEGSGVYSLRDSSVPGVGDINPVCTECGQTFDRCGKGQWIPANHGAPISGYAISRLFIGKRSHDILELWNKFREARNNPSAMQNFHNQWLGVPYENKEDKLTEPVLIRCVGTHRTGVRDDMPRCTAGIDQGKNYHVQISEIIEGRRHKVYIGSVYDKESLRGILEKYNVSDLVLDAQGGGYAETRELVASIDGAWMCFYRPKDQVKAVYDCDQKDHVVKTNRTEMCDLMVKSYKDGQVVLPVDWEAVDSGEFKKHMLVPHRLFDRSTGLPIWTKGVDHYFHADVYDYLAFLISGMWNSSGETGDWRV